jgi:ribosomal-protein-alanine N-acetyltransferase
MSLSITIAAMAPSHLPHVLEIERLSFPTPWSPGLFLHELKLPFSRVRVAHTSGNGNSALVGYVCWWLVAEEAHILNLAVHPDHRRRGIAATFVDLVVADATEQKATCVTLEVRRDNVPAQELYGRFGFDECGVRRNYYGRGDDAIIMTRQVNGAVGSP